ncbi:MAG: FtsQ-type POTRA domain-containing protein, partial [Rhizobiales bacterium]|nr:FtsQ-type POTRA domain-containing protein [Hyphomicrobiales bacterium]
MRQIGRRATGEGSEGTAPSRHVSWLYRRVRGFARREWTLPAHAGLKATVLLFIATGVAGVVAADRVGEVSADLGRASGLLVDNVRITGQIETSEVAVLDRLQLAPDSALPFIDVEAARARIETLPWVQQATLRKIYPSTLKITIDERAPFALWQHD